MQTSWRPTRRLLPRDKRFMRLSKDAKRLLLVMYVVCDAHGRGPTDAYELRQLTGFIDDTATEVDACVAELAASELLVLSDDGAAWELEDYDSMLSEDSKRKRSKSSLFPPGRHKGALTAPEGRPNGAQTAPSQIPPTPPLDQETCLERPNGRRARDTSARMSASERPQGRTGQPPIVGEVGQGIQGREGGKEGAGGRSAGEPRRGGSTGGAVGSGASGVSKAGKGQETGQGEPVWPSAEHEKSASAWLDALYRFARNGMPSGSPHMSTLGALARAQPDGFVAACATTIAWGETWPGWNVRQPLAWLRTECFKAVRAAAPRPPPPPPDLRAISQRASADNEPETTIALDLADVDPRTLHRLGWEEKRRRAYLEHRDGRRVPIADRPDLLALLDWSDQLASREPAPAWFIAGGQA